MLNFILPICSQISDALEAVAVAELVITHFSLPVKNAHLAAAEFLHVKMAGVGWCLLSGLETSGSFLTHVSISARY